MATLFPPPGLEAHPAETSHMNAFGYDYSAEHEMNPYMNDGWSMTEGVRGFNQLWSMSGVRPDDAPAKVAFEGDWQGAHEDAHPAGSGMPESSLPNPWASQYKDEEVGLLGEGVMKAMLGSLLGEADDDENALADMGMNGCHMTAPAATCRWHESANKVGIVSGDGHVFTKTSGGHKVVTNSRGMSVELPSICMVFDQTLRCGGMHQYNYQLLDGELGVADGAGFVFDSKVRRKNIQQMRSVFLNQRGRVCIRDHEHILKLGAQLPPLTLGMWLTLQIDLDCLHMHLAVFSPEGYLTGATDFSVDGLFKTGHDGEQLNSGFFCAVMTRDVSVALA